MSENITEPPGENFEVHAKLPNLGEIKLTLYEGAWNGVAQFWRQTGWWIVGALLLSIFGVQSQFITPQQPPITPAAETAKPLPKR